MTTNRDDEWSDDEIVPLGDLRPSREHFGPVPASRAQGTPADPSSQTSRPRPSAKQRPGRNDGSQQRGQRPQQRPARPAAAKRSAHTDQVRQKAPSGKAPQEAPASGWRNIVHRATGGVVNFGLSEAERQEAVMRKHVRRPLTDATVAVFSRKGGVGKTTISAYLGLTYAEERGGRIVALDGDAEAGSLGWLLAPNAPPMLAALASAEPMPSDYAGIRRYTTVTDSGLELIVGDPAEMGPISTIGLETVVDQLARNYDVSIFDTGAGVTRATGRVLVNSARVLLLVMGSSVDSVRAAERTLSWLDERPGEVADANAQVIAVINGISSSTKASHIDRIAEHFSDRCSAVVRIPWDAHLAAGESSASLDRLSKPTRRAFLELAATTSRTLAMASRPVASSTGGRHG